MFHTNGIKQKKAKIWSYFKKLLTWHLFFLKKLFFRINEVIYSLVVSDLWLFVRNTKKLMFIHVSYTNLQQTAYKVHFPIKNGFSSLSENVAKPYIIPKIKISLCRIQENILKRRNKNLNSCVSINFVKTWRTSDYIC